MNILFLIGNGFDLNIGLNTRFQNALSYYLKKSNNNPRTQKFKKDIDKNFEKWSDFENQMGIYTKEFTPKNVDDYCFCIRDFRESLVEHLKNEELRINYDTQKEAIVSVFRKSIINFYENLVPASLNALRALTNQKNEAIYYNFITFNYTNVIDKCIEIIKHGNSPFNSRKNGNHTLNDTINQILHIHGTTQNNVIMGVDNAEQIVNTELSKNTKLARTIIKPVINEKLKNLNDRTGISIINNSNIICVFGLSLGETDKTWWKIIGEWLKKGNNQLVIFDIVPQWNPIHPEDSIEIIDALIEKFCAAAGIKPESSLTDKIHIGFNTNLFKINLTNQSIQENDTVSVLA